MSLNYTPKKAKSKPQQELSESTQAYRERNKKEAERFKEATDIEFWFALCFQTENDFHHFFPNIKNQDRVTGPGLRELWSEYQPDKKLKQIGGKPKYRPLSQKPLVDDPHDSIEYPEDMDLERDCMLEFKALLEAMESYEPVHPVKDITDSDVYLIVVFDSCDSKEQFLEDFNLLALGDKYLDGHKVAKKLSIS